MRALQAATKIRSKGYIGKTPAKTRILFAWNFPLHQLTKIEIDFATSIFI